jgi:hypothetical protein
MELFAIFFGIIISCFASCIYGAFMIKLYRDRPPKLEWLVKLSVVLSLLVLPLFMFEAAVLYFYGTVRAFKIFDPWLSHVQVVVFFLAPPSITHVFAMLFSKVKVFKELKIFLVAAPTIVVCAWLLFNQYIIAEDLHGIEGVSESRTNQYPGILNKVKNGK